MSKKPEAAKTGTGAATTVEDALVVEPQVSFVIALRHCEFEQNNKIERKEKKILYMCWFFILFLVHFFLFCFTAA